MKKAQQELPQFLVLHTAEEEFLLCFEINGALQCWVSTHPPSMDVRYKRIIRKGEKQPLTAIDKPRKGTEEWDRGTYVVGTHKTKKEIEKAFLAGLSENKLSFLLNGRKVQGRFIIHYNDTANALMLYKKKDKFQREEDPLEIELKRSMNKWVPKYDPEKVKLTEPMGDRKQKGQEEKPKAGAPGKKAESAQGRKTVASKAKKEKHVAQSAMKKKSDGKFTYEIKGKEYEFTLFKALDGKSGELVCLVAGEDTDIFVMRPVQKNKWQIITSIGVAIARNEDSFSDAILEFLER